MIHGCRGYRMAMAHDPGDFQRARRPEQKQQREAAILAAARDLGLREGVRNISLGDIATDVGMHKTALLRYFETREEIFLKLATQGWIEWAATLSSQIYDLPDGDHKGIAAAFAHTLDERPLLCDLLTHAPLNLERNVSVGSVLNFKLTAIASVKQLSIAVRAIVPDLTDDDAADLVTGVSAIAAGLWQITHPPPTLTQLYLENPTVAHSYIEFVPTVTRLAETLILGFRAGKNGT